LEFDTRVADGVVGEDSRALSNTTGILVEDDFALILNELAGIPNTEDLAPGSWPSFKVVSGAGKTSPQGIRCIPCMVMRDFACDMVSNVGLGDTMGSGGADPASDLANDAITTEEGAVKRG